MRFFFYGTLIAGRGNRVAGAAHTKLEPIGAATVRGCLFAIDNPGGWYPALRPGAGLVHGVLYAALPGFGPGDLARLDAYEDFDPANPDAALYHRREVPVTRAGEPAGRAQTYILARPPRAGTDLIEDGDFLAWLARTGATAFGQQGEN